MGDEDKIDTMLNAFLNAYGWEWSEVPYFNKDGEYFMIQKRNEHHELVSDSWDGFKKGWVAREEVDDHTVDGW